MEVTFVEWMLKIVEYTFVEGSQTFIALKLGFVNGDWRFPDTKCVKQSVRVGMCEF